MMESQNDLKQVGWVGLLTPGIIAAGVSALIAGAVFFVPDSPMSLGRVDTVLGAGEATVAVRAYEELARSSKDVSTRKIALRRAASIHQVTLNQPQQAIRHLKVLLSLGVSPTHEGVIRAQLAELHLDQQDPVAASHQYKRAYQADTSSPQYLIRAAEIRSAEGHNRVARDLWQMLRDQEPAHAARANLGLGEVALARGRAAAALSPFQAASRSKDEGVAKAARLGLAACYERLGELDGALAELDLTDLPEDVRELRQAGLRERAAAFGR